MELWEVAVQELLNRDDEEHKKIKAEVTKHKPGDPEYEKWARKFYELHLFNTSSMPGGQWPSDAKEALITKAQDPLVYHTMWVTHSLLAN